MFKLFESWINPLPDKAPVKPPKSLYAFCRHYSRGFEIPLVLMSLLTAALAILEVSLFSFMGELVDLLSQHTPESLFEAEGIRLLGMSLLVLIAMPMIVLLHGLIIYQGLLGNYPMSIRWQAHRYLLKQSVSFYQNDFAGRIANKVMQTALSVRETVTKLLDVIVYIFVYFCSFFMLGSKIAQSKASRMPFSHLNKSLTTQLWGILAPTLRVRYEVKWPFFSHTAHKCTYLGPPNRVHLRLPD